MKDSIIYCLNSEKETTRLIIKNMPDLEELENIEMIDRKIHLVECISFGLSGTLTYIFILSLIWFLAPQTMAVYSLGDCFYMIILLIIYATHFMPVSIIERLIKRRIAIRRGCDYIWQYMSSYSDSKWNNLMLIIRATRRMHELLKYADERNIEISFARKSFTLDWKDYTENGDQINRYEIFCVRSIITNCILEKNTVEFDFFKNELRISKICDVA